MSGELVLVTGGSGFIGAHCILKLLASGYRVRTTVRTLEREASVRAMLKTGGAEPGEALSFVAADLMSDEETEVSARESARVIEPVKGYLESLLKAAVPIAVWNGLATEAMKQAAKNLDAKNAAQVIALLTKIARAGTTVVVATHDLELAARIADRVVALEDGAIRDLGPAAAALSGSSPYATEIGALYPGGPVTIEGMPRCA